LLKEVSHIRPLYALVMMDVGSMELNSKSLIESLKHLIVFKLSLLLVKVGTSCEGSTLKKENL
jgi:hypothetical protein